MTSATLAARVEAQVEAQATELAEALAGAQVVDPGSAVAGMVLVAAAGALFPVCAYLLRRIVPGRRVFFARWGFSHLVGVVGVFLLALFLVSPLAHALIEVGYARVFAGLCSMVLVFGVTAPYIAWLALRLDPDGIACLGLRPNGQLRAGFAGVVAYVLMVPLLYGLGLLWPWLAGVLELDYGPQEVAVGMLELSGLELALAIPLAVLVQPFFEEFVFRGFLQPLLVQNLGDRGGVVATSVIFGAMHGVSAFLPVFGLSLILGGVMLRTQRLFGPFVIHALHNGLTLVFLFNFSEPAEAAAGLPVESLLQLLP